MPRFIVALGTVGAIALIAAVVGIALTYESPASDEQDLRASAEATGEASAPYTSEAEGAIPDEPPVVEEFESIADGPSAAEIEAQAEDSDAEETGPAPEGEPLPTLSSMPQGTLGLLALPEGFERAEYRALFSPYGWGAGGSEACSLVITVHEVDLTSGDDGALTSISGKNACVWVDPADLEILGSGGEFEGIIEVRRQGNVGALFLTDVSRD